MEPSAVHSEFTPAPAQASAAAALVAHAGEGAWLSLAARVAQAYCPGCAGVAAWWYEPPQAPVMGASGHAGLVAMPEYLARSLLSVSDRVGPRSAWLSDATWNAGAYATARGAAGLGDFVRADWTVEGPARLIVQVDLHAPESDRPAAEPASKDVVQTLHLLRPLLVECGRVSVLGRRAHRAGVLARVPRAARAAVPLMIAGRSEMEIAQTLHKSRHTVHDYVKNVYASLGISTRLELLRVWLGV